MRGERGGNVWAEGRGEWETSGDVEEAGLYQMDEEGEGGREFFNERAVDGDAYRFRSFSEEVCMRTASVPPNVLFLVCLFQASPSGELVGQVCCCRARAQASGNENNKGMGCEKLRPNKDQVCNLSSYLTLLRGHEDRMWLPYSPIIHSIF